MRASVNEKKRASVRECCVVASVENIFQERNLHPKTSFQTCDGIRFLEFFQLIFLKYYCLCGGFRCTLIISRTPSETFGKVKRSVERVLIS